MFHPWIENERRRRMPARMDTPPDGGWDAGPNISTPPINPNSQYAGQPGKGDPGDPYGGRGPQTGGPMGQAFGTMSLPPQNVDGYVPSPGDLGLPDVYEDLEPVHAALKDQIALKAKKGNRLPGYFTGDNLGKSVQEIAEEQDIMAADMWAQQMLAKSQQDAQVAQEKMRTESDQMFDQLVGLVKGMPKPPTRGAPEMPNALQAGVSLLAGLMTPEHALDSASIPFLNSLNEREMRYEEAQQTYKAETMVQQMLMEIASERGKTINQFNLADWQAAEQKVINAQKSLMDDENDQRASIRNIQEEDRKWDQSMIKLGAEQEFEAQKIAVGQSHEMRKLDKTQQNAELNKHWDNYLSEKGDPFTQEVSRQVINGMLGMELPKRTELSAEQQKAYADALKSISDANVAIATEGDRITKAGLDNRNTAVETALRLKDLEWYDTKITEQINNDRERLRLAQESGNRDAIAAANKQLNSQITYLNGEKKKLDEELKALDAAAMGADGINAISVRTSQTARRLQIQQEKEAIDNEIQDIRGDIAGVRKGGLGAELVGKTNYKWGGTDPKTGVDCSGLTCYVAENDFGVKIPRTAKEQFGKLPKVGEADLEDGDFVYFTSSGPSGWHTGVIFFKGDEPWVRHASSDKPGVAQDVKESPLSGWKDSQIRGYRRARGYKGAG